MERGNVGENKATGHASCQALPPSYVYVRNVSDERFWKNEGRTAKGAHEGFQSLQEISFFPFPSYFCKVKAAM